MPWPQATDYNSAIQCPRACFSDPDLRNGQAEADLFGLPRPHAGNFADVYQVRGPDGQAWAVKCFTREVPGLQQRYAAVSDHLASRRRAFMVDFRYLPEGIRVRGEWFPVLKMRWVEGLRLNEFVRDHADKPAILERLALMWVRLAAELRDARLAHGDLQHGNVLLVPGSGPQSLKLKLIDYDGMWVPALAGSPSGEVGHPNYQHPERLGGGLYGPDVDRFAHLLISAALRCVQAGGRELWDRHDNGENLLFREEDLRRPGDSRLLAELWALDAPDAHALLGRLILAARAPAELVPRLEAVAARGAVEPLSAVEEEYVDDLLRVAVPARRSRARAAVPARALTGAGAAARAGRTGTAAATATLPAAATETLPDVQVGTVTAAPQPAPWPAGLARLWPVGLAAAGLAVVLLLVLSVRLLVWSMGKGQPPPAAGPQPARLRDLPPLSARAGQRGAVEIAVERRDSAGPLTVRLEGLPERVACPPLTLEAGRDAGRLELRAAADAAGDYPVRVTLWDGERQADERAAALTVAEFLKPDVLRKTGPPPLPPGGTAAVVVEVDRHDCDEPLTLRLDGLPAGVTQEPVPAGPGEKAVRLVLKAAPGAPPGPYITKLSLWAGPVKAAEDLVKVEIDARPVRSPAAEAAAAKAPRLKVQGPKPLRPGGSQDLIVRLERNGHRGPVEVKVEGLPAGVTDWPTTVPADRDEVAVGLYAAAAAADVVATAHVQAWADGRKLAEQEVQVTVRKPAAPGPAVEAPRTVPVLTVDGAKLTGSYYPSPKGRQAACVLLLHDPELGPAADDWGRLARVLQERGYAVLRLDFRGHGGSTEVDPTFFGDFRANQSLPAFRKARGRQPLTTLSGPLPPAYRPWLVNDVAGARLFFDERNDAEELNSANLVVVGAGEGAALGALWLAAECARRELGVGADPHFAEGRYAAAVWLDLPANLGGRYAPVGQWLRQAGNSRGIPMNFVYGEENKAAAAQARRHLREARPAGRPAKLTVATPVPGAPEGGQQLLRQGLPTERLVADWLDAALAARGDKPWVPRGERLKSYTWSFGVKQEVPAKVGGARVFRPVPLERFGLPAL